MINVTLLQTNDTFSLLKEEWNTLLKQSSVDDAFLTWEWLSTWWKYFGDDYQLCVLAAHEHGQLVGIAPLMLEKQKVIGLNIRVLRNIGAPPPDVAGLIIRKGRDDVLVKLACWLVENQKMWDVLSIREIPPGGLNLDIWKAQFPKDNFVFQLETSRHFFIPMDKGWDIYYQDLSKNLRKDLKKKIRHLREGNDYKFSRKIGSKVNSLEIESIFKINENARITHQYNNQIKKDFHRELVRLMAEQGWLDLSFIFIGDTPVAFRYGFYYNNCFEDWRTAFDTAFFQFSVGKILLFFVIQDSFERGLKSLHFLRGDEDYKSAWQVETQMFSHIQVVRKTAKSMLTHVHFQKVKRRLRLFINELQCMHALISKYDERVSQQ